MSAFSVLPYMEEQQERWDRFVMEQSANGTFLQTRRFFLYRKAAREVNLFLRNIPVLIGSSWHSSPAQNYQCSFEVNPGG